MDKGRKQIKHITDSDEFYDHLVEDWMGHFSDYEGDEGQIYYQSLMLLDYLAGETYRFFALFDVKAFRVLHASPQIYEMLQYDQDTLKTEKNPSFFMKLLAKRHFKYLVKVLVWLKKNHKLKPEFDQNDYIIIYKGLKLRKKNGEEISTVIRQIKPKGHSTARLTMLELIDTSHLVDDDHFSMRTKVIGQDSAVSYYHTNKAYAKSADVFSDREMDILKLMAKGKSTQEIGDELFISHRTVSTHKRNMLDKIGAKDASAMLELCKIIGIAGL